MAKDKKEKNYYESLEKASIAPEVESAFLAPEFYPHEIGKIEVAETHISTVFLTGPFAYKVKKPVSLGFLDFSTLFKRRAVAEKELLLNQRLSSGVYLDVVAITRETGGLALEGPGEPVEYAVKMRQLPRERTMGELLSRGELERGMVEELAKVLADFYKGAESGPEIDRMGSLEVIRNNVEENFAQTRPFVPDILDKEGFDFIHRILRDFMERESELFDMRIRRGHIRDCHGDLRLDHVYFLDAVQIIDCIEFNERFRYSDVAADLAYLAMDMDYHACRALGRALIHHYALAAEDPEVYSVLDFYKCYRAHVRCKVKCIHLAEGRLSRDQESSAREVAARFFDLARFYARVLSRKTLWVVCGMIASGKSTIAGELARRLRVEAVSSDITRKRLFGLDSRDEAVSGFGEGIYAPSRTDETYRAMLDEARKELSRGRSAVLDATFAGESHRGQVRSLARDMGANVVFVECVCPEEVIKERLLERKGAGTVSDARLEHLARFEEAFEPLDELGRDEHLRVSTDRSLTASLVDVFEGAYAREHIQTEKAFRGGK